MDAPLQQQIAAIALVVRDYDEAIAFYVEKLGFTLIEDTPLSATKRWVRVQPPGGSGTALLLAKAVGEEQEMAIGNQSGGRVFLFLHTNNFAAYYRQLQSAGVSFVRDAETQPWGTVAVFKDLYGNLWDLIQPHQTDKA